jgi:pantoate--beta-alanine ligase
MVPDGVRRPIEAWNRTMQILRTRDDLSSARAAMGRVALVPTMGALHAGHLALVAAARRAAPAVVATIFVNPTQFSAAEGSASYPRTEADDLRQLEAAGCDAVWLPAVGAIYPAGDATAVDPGGPALDWEGTQRPGHFRGMATVVAKLFGLVRPDIACFGEKDWQQLQVVRRMVADLALPLAILGVPTVREADGLAMSSRNRFLSTGERARAPLLHACLQEAAEQVRSRGEAALEEARARLGAAGFGVDYLALVDGPTLRPSPDGNRIIAAARLGPIRLLDNLAVG